MSGTIEAKLLAKQTRPTSMRILVYDYLSAQNQARSLSEIEQALYPVDRITVYRTLKTFEEKGIIHSIQENNTSKFSLREAQCRAGDHHDRHLHLYCKRCKQTTCHQDITLPEVLQGNFKVEEVRLFVRGVCENCLSETLQ